MEVKYSYSTWVERINPSGEVKVMFSGRGTLTGEGDEILVFEAPINPFYVAVHGDWVKGYLVEVGDIYRFMIIPRNRGPGDRVKVRMVVRGVLLPGVFDRRTYRVAVNWRGRHMHSISLAGDYKVTGVTPRGYRLSRHGGLTTISWLWRRGYAGQISMTLIRRT